MTYVSYSSRSSQSLLNSKPRLLKRPINMLEHIQITSTELALLGHSLKVGIMITIILCKLTGITQIQILILDIVHLKALTEYPLQASPQDPPLRELIPEGQPKHQNGEVKGKAILVVGVDELVDEGLAAVVLFDRDEHYYEVEERHEQWVQLQLTHYLFGEFVVEFVLADETAQEQPFVDPVQDYEGEEGELQADWDYWGHCGGNQDGFVDIRVSQCQIYGVSLVKCIGLALSGCKLLGNPPPPIQPPAPDNIKVAHHTAHIRIRNEQEEEVIDQPQKVQREMRIGTLPVRNDPKRHKVREVGGCQHINHKDVGQLVAHCREVVRHGGECAVFTGEVPDHYTEEGVETAADYRAGCGHADQQQLVYCSGLLDLYEFFQQGQDEEVADQGQNEEQHMPFGHFTTVLVLGVGEVLVDEVCRVVALLNGVVFAVFADILPGFDTIESNNTLATEQEITGVTAIHNLTILLMKIILKILHPLLNLIRIPLHGPELPQLPIHLIEHIMLIDPRSRLHELLLHPLILDLGFLSRVNRLEFLFVHGDVLADVEEEVDLYDDLLLFGAVGFGEESGEVGGDGGDGGVARQLAQDQGIVLDQELFGFVFSFEELLFQFEGLDHEE